MDEKDQERKRKKGFLRRHPWWTAVVLISGVLVVLLDLVIIPWGIRWYSEKWLEQHGEYQARIQDVDYNLLTSTAVLQLLVGQGEHGRIESVRTSAEVNWIPLFRKRLKLGDVLLRNTTLTLEMHGGYLAIGGILMKPSPWGVGLQNVDMENVTLLFRIGGLEQKVRVVRAHFDPVQTWNPESSGDFTAVLKIENGTITLDGSANPFGNAGIQGDIQVEQLPLGWTQPLFSGVQGIGGTLGGKGYFRMGEGIPSRLVRGNYTIRRLTGRTGDLEVSPSTLSLDGTLAVQKEGDGSATTANGTVSLQDMQAKSSAYPVRFKGERVSFTGSFEQNTGKVPAKATYLLTGQGRMRKIALGDRESNRTLLAAEEISLDGIRAEGAREYGANVLRIRNGRVLERTQADSGDPFVFSFASLALRNFGLDAAQNRIGLQDVTLQGGEGRLVRGEKKGFSLLEVLPGSSQDEKGNAKERSYRVGRFSMGNGTGVRFRDERVDPVADITLTNVQFTLEELRSNAGNNASPIRLQADIGQYSRLHMQGTVQPLADRISMDITGKLTRFSLPELTGYAEKHFGYAIKSGQLDSDFLLRAEQAELDSSLELIISELQLTEVEKSGQGGFGVPVKTAIGLLKNEKGNLKITIPVKGSLQDPELQLGDLVLRTIQEGFATAIQSAAATMFEPMGAVFEQGKLGDRQISLRLDPFRFEPGKSQLDDQMRAKIERIAAKLKKRPALSLVLCGRAVPADRKELRRAYQQSPSEQNLRNLAGNRAETIRQALVANGIAVKRLVICAPEIESEADGAPRVEIGI